MMKKLIAGVLSLVMVLSSSVFVAFGEDAPAEPTPISADVEFAKAIGIFADDVVPQEPVKRIDLAKCILNVILKGTELATDDGSTLFDDVDYDNSGYADAIAKVGIMGGTGGRQFSPDANVTYAQLLKVFVSFLGYDVKAQGLGGYPSGYMAVATQLDITDKYAPYGDSFITWETLATMFKRALGVPLFQVVYYKDSTFIYNPNTTKDYLREYFGIKRYSDVINAVYNTSVDGYNDVEYDEILLGNTVFRFDTDALPLSDKLGYRIEAYYTEEDGFVQIVYYDEYDNDVILLDGRDVEGYENGILYYNGKKEKKIEIGSETNVIYNTKLCATYDDSLFSVWNLSSKDGSLKAIDNNSDGTYDFVILDAYESYVVGTVTGDIIIPKYRTSAFVDISSYNEGENALFYNLKGKPISKDKVVEGCVISVSHDLDGNVTSIVVTTDSYTGEIEEIEVENGRHYITVLGTRYTPSEVLSLNPQLETLRAGQKVTMMFNKGGLLSDVDTLQFQVIDVGYVYAAKRGSSLEAKNSATIRIFSSGGFFQNYDFAKNVEVVNGDETDVKSAIEVLTLLGKTDTTDVTRQVIKFKKNEEGKINWINIANDEDSNINALYRYDLAALGMTANPKYLVSGFEGKLLVSGTAVFSVPSEENRYNEDLYFTGTMANKNYNVVEAYGDEIGEKVALALVIENNASGTFTDSPGYMIVESITKAMDSDRVPSLKVTGFVGGTRREYFGDEEVFESSPTGALPEKGDIIKFKVDKENRIAKLSEYLFDASEKASDDIEKVFPSTKINPNFDTHNEVSRYAFGKIIWSNDESFIIEVNKGAGSIINEAYLKSTTCRYYTCENLGEKNGIVKRAKAQDVFAFPEGAAKANYAMVFVSYGTLMDVIVYK